MPVRRLYRRQRLVVSLRPTPGGDDVPRCSTASVRHGVGLERGWQRPSCWAPRRRAPHTTRPVDAEQSISVSSSSMKSRRPRFRRPQQHPPPRLHQAHRVLVERYREASIPVLFDGSAMPWILLAQRDQRHRGSVSQFRHIATTGDRTPALRADIELVLRSGGRRVVAPGSRPRPCHP